MIWLGMRYEYFQIDINYVFGWEEKMIVADIQRCLELYAGLFLSGSGFQVKYSRPWHPNRSKDDDPISELNAKSGVYIYSKPGDPNWDLPLMKNQNAIWYIGKSRRSIRARVWANLGAFKEENGSTCNPMFKYNRWANDKRIRDDSIKDAIGNGEFVAYSIAVLPVGLNFAPEIVETYLLTCFYRSTGTLPVLNSLISQYKVSR